MVGWTQRQATWTISQHCIPARIGWFKGGFPNGVGNWSLPLEQCVDATEWPSKSLSQLGTGGYGTRDTLNASPAPEIPRYPESCAQKYPDFRAGLCLCCARTIAALLLLQVMLATNHPKASIIPLGSSCGLNRSAYVGPTVHRAIVSLLFRR